MNKQKIFRAVCLALTITSTLTTSSFAVSTRKTTSSDVVEQKCIEYSLEGGSVKFVDATDYMVLYIDRPSQENKNNVLRSLNGDIEFRQSIATIYVPYKPEFHNAIYKDLADSVENSLASLQNGSNTISDYDKNYCAEFTVTVDFTKETKDDGFTYYDLTKVRGGFYDPGTSGDYVGENVYVTQQYIDVGQIGTGYDGNKYLEQHIYNYPLPTSKRSWSYDPPYSWVAVTNADWGGTVGAIYHFTLSRGSSTWSNSINVSAFV